MKTNKRTIQLAKELGMKPMNQEQEELAKKIASNSFNSTKYKESLKFITLLSMQDIMSKHPDSPISQVIIKSMEGINPDIPPKLLLEVVSYLVSQWEESYKMEKMAA